MIKKIKKSFKIGGGGGGGSIFWTNSHILFVKSQQLKKKFKKMAKFFLAENHKIKQNKE